MNILILIKLLVAHIIGDFFLQTDTICEGKNSKGFRRLTYLAIHSGINACTGISPCRDVGVLADSGCGICHSLYNRLCEVMCK